MFQRFAISGSTGLIGTAVSRLFNEQGCQVVPIVRFSTPLKTNRRVIRWDIGYEKIDAAQLEGFDAIINFSGAGIADRRWTPEYKKVIRDSRIKSTALLAKTLVRLKKPPRVFICASAVGFYGHGGMEEPKEESSSSGTDFLALLCRDWEHAASVAGNAGIRVVHLRFGVVLDKAAGALAKMLPVFRVGLGGNIGSGKQMMSWIALSEIPFIIRHVIENTAISGPVNCVSPSPVTNEEFAKTLSRVLHRPAVLPLPSFAAKIMFGEMADSLLLGGQKVVPEKLLKSGYQFKFANLESVLAEMLTKKRQS